MIWYPHPHTEFGALSLDMALHGLSEMVATAEKIPGISDVQQQRLDVFRNLVYLFKQVQPHYKDWVDSVSMLDKNSAIPNERSYDRIIEIMSDDFEPEKHGSLSWLMAEFALIIQEKMTQSPAAQRQALPIMLPAYSIFHHIHNEFTYARRRVSQTGSEEEGAATSPEI